MRFGMNNHQDMSTLSASDSTKHTDVIGTIGDYGINRSVNMQASTNTAAPANTGTADNSVQKSAQSKQTLEVKLSEQSTVAKAGSPANPSSQKG